MKSIQLLTLTILLCCTVFTSRAQSDLKARIEFEKAEAAFAQGDYVTAITHLSATEKLRNAYAPRVSHLKIMSLDAVCDYTNPQNPNFVQLQAEVKRYLDYADRNQATVVMDKYREVYAVNGKIEVAKGVGTLSQAELVQRLNTARETGDNSAIVLYCKTLATQGLPDAMVFMGVMLHKGDAGMEKNIPEAIQWLEKAVSQDPDNVRAMQELGAIYLEEEKYRESLNWFEKVAMKGDVDAMHYTGYLYYVLKDDVKALRWYEKAAENGNVKAMEATANLYHVIDPNALGMTKKEAKKKKEEWDRKVAANKRGSQAAARRQAFESIGGAMRSTGTNGSVSAGRRQ